MNEHYCKCLSCAPDERLTGPRLGPNHQGVRFTTYRREEPYLNGERCDSAFEAMVGEEGWVAVYPRVVMPNHDAPARHLCARCNPRKFYGPWGTQDDDTVTSDTPKPQPCYDILYGRVEMRDRQPVEV